MTDHRLTQQAIEQFLERTKGTDYQRRVLELLARTTYPETRDCGLGLMDFLDQYDLRVGDYSTTDDGDAGSLEECGAIAACAFARVSEDSLWWLNEFRDSLPGERDLSFWKARFEGFPDVQVLGGWSAGAS
jgi:hypothetical protein